MCVPEQGFGKTVPLQCVQLLSKRLKCPGDQGGCLLPQVGARALPFMTLMHGSVRIDSWLDVRDRFVRVSRVHDQLYQPVTFIKNPSKNCPVVDKLRGGNIKSFLHRTSPRILHTARKSRPAKVIS